MLQFSFSTDTIAIANSPKQVEQQIPARNVTLHDNRFAKPAVAVVETDNKLQKKNWRLDSAHERSDVFTFVPHAAPKIAKVAEPEMATTATINSSAIAGRINVPTRASIMQIDADSDSPDYNNIKTTLGISDSSKPARFEAAMEVEQFAWLPMVENLCLQHPVALDRILAELKPDLQAGRRIVAINSVRQGEGRTTLVQCLARRAAMQGLKTCVIDADHQFPQLSEQLGLEIDIGWEATLTTPFEINELAIESVRDDLTFVPLHQPVNDEVLVTLHEKCERWLSELKTVFDLIILDTAPLVDAMQSEIATKLPAVSHPLTTWPIDHWLIVRNVQETSVADLARWQRRVQSLNLNILGIIENRTKLEVPSSVYQG